jgi:REP element-mobilizing transposase RayT
MVHAVWCTKYRRPFLNDQILPAVLDHIRINARRNGIHVDIINGHVDHVHALIGLNTTLSISKVIQLLKGESAFWINRQNLLSDRFEWANEYFVVSIAPSEIYRVRAYILNQQIHHSTISFDREWAKFAARYGVSVNMSV